VGWCPLGYRDRPVLVRRGRPRGHAVPRGSARPGPEATSPWVYARRNDLGTRDLARRRLDSPPADLREVRTLEPGRTRLTRDLRVVDGDHAVPRAVRTRPTIGDSVPELRNDPATTIPFPAARRRGGRDERTESEERQENRAVARPRPRAAEPAASAPAVQAPGASIGDPDVVRYRDARPRGGDGDASRDGAATPENERRRDPDRDVLRPLFRPLTRPRPAAEAQERGGNEGGSQRRRSLGREDDGDRPRHRAEPVERNEAPRRVQPESRRVQPESRRVQPEPRRSQPEPRRSQPESRRVQPERRRDAPPPSRSNDERAVRRRKKDN
jgi:hypothetical protein